MAAFSPREILFVAEGCRRGLTAAEITNALNRSRSGTRAWIERAERGEVELTDEGYRQGEEEVRVSSDDREWVEMHLQAVDVAAVEGEMPTRGNPKAALGGRAGEMEEMDPPCYVYLDDREAYLFHLRCVPNPLIVPRGTIERIYEEYSNLGERATRAKVAASVGWEEEVLREVQNALGMTHDSLPVSDERLERASEGSVVHDILAARRGRVVRRSRRAWQRAIEAGASKWFRLQEDTFRPLMAWYTKHSHDYEPPRLSLPDADEPYALILAPYDLHYGKDGGGMEWYDERGYRYGREEARARLLECTETMLAEAVINGGPEIIFLVTGGDWFHIDRPEATTTRGTPQDVDGSLGQILGEGCELAQRQIDLLQQVSDVDVMVIQGNHDHVLSFAMQTHLIATYQNNDRVAVRWSNTVRDYRTYGNTLFCAVHGHQVGFKKLAQTMAMERPARWGEARFRLGLCGHLHHSKYEADRGVLIEQLPSLSGLDRYHHSHGFLGQAAMVGYRLTRESCRLTRYYVPWLDDWGRPTHA